MRSLVLKLISGTLLLLSRIFHWLGKTVLKIPAFSVKSVTKISFTRRGWAVGILTLFISLFTIDQYVLGPFKGSFSLLPRLVK